MFVHIQFRPRTHRDLESLTAGELVRAVEELRLGAGAEHTRRRELEAALRESAAIFKRELHDKNLELAALQQQLGSALLPHLHVTLVYISCVPTAMDSQYCDARLPSSDYRKRGVCCLML